MKKSIVLLILFVSIISILSACNNEEPPDLNNTGAPESYFEYGFNEECSDGTNHLKIESFEISMSYPTDTDAELTSNSECFVVLGVKTNLTEADFTNQDNLVELWISPSQRIVLEFALFDVNNGKLVYQISENNDLDYTHLSNLMVSNSNEVFSHLTIILNAFDKYCTIKGSQYCGRYITFTLEEKQEN